MVDEQHSHFIPSADMINHVAAKDKDFNEWRITVTDYFGGRGHDYKGKGPALEEINDNGGTLGS
jgi:hypothetical protein